MNEILVAIAKAQAVATTRDQKPVEKSIDFAALREVGMCRFSKTLAYLTICGRAPGQTARAA
jgi:hypothetical protein